MFELRDLSVLLVNVEYLNTPVSLVKYFNSKYPVIFMVFEIKSSRYAAL